ncbi:protein YgfX [Ferrimonas senticii]|uniref:protein YgfX n=1 Tax=Ferrimonas senticii TaxID=394566 RepID=UPI0004105CFF|nr:hypothetical protein [Ferrimonas senticii]
MNETSPNTAPFHFVPVASANAASSHCWLIAALLSLLLSWPWLYAGTLHSSAWVTWPWYGLALQLLMLVLLGCWGWINYPATAAPFSLWEHGVGRSASGVRFELSARSRLLPWGALLHSRQLGWQLLWRDSMADSDWRRLCRILLQAQRPRD